MSTQGKHPHAAPENKPTAANDTNHAIDRRSILLGGTTLAAAATAFGASAPITVTPAQAQQPPPSERKPNILFIMGDDIGWFNISAYNMGVMGYRTPNIDRIGKEGAVAPARFCTRLTKALLRSRSLAARNTSSGRGINLLKHDPSAQKPCAKTMLDLVMVVSVIDDYAATVGITLKAVYDAENLSGAMSLVASTGGVTLFPLYVRNMLTPNAATPIRLSALCEFSFSK
jgi:hypothetical protein